MNCTTSLTSCQSKKQSTYICFFAPGRTSNGSAITGRGRNSFLSSLKPTSQNRHLLFQRAYNPAGIINFVAMAGLIIPEQQDGFLSSVSDAPPTHYVVELQSFSLLTKNNIDKYISGGFKAGGYKWKLVIYPNGNKAKNVSDSLSMYVMMEKESIFHDGLEVHAVFKMFILDQNQDNYLTFEVGKARCFNKVKLESGFDRLMPLKTFNDPSNGYLVNDACVFGVEIYIRKENNARAKGENLLVMGDAISYKHSWKIESFSSLTGNPEESEPFQAGEQKWKVQLYPKGKGTGSGSYISLYLALADPTSLSAGSQIYAEFTLRIMDQIQNNYLFTKNKYWFSASKSVFGWPRFVSLIDFNRSGRGLLVKNSCIVEAEVTVHGIADRL